MGRDYDAAVIVSGLCGFGMGATPNAMANMQAAVSYTHLDVYKRQVAHHVVAAGVQTGKQAVPIALHILRLHAQLFGDGAGDLHIIAHQSVALVMVEMCIRDSCCSPPNKSKNIERAFLHKARCIQI